MAMNNVEHVLLHIKTALDIDQRELDFLKQTIGKTRAEQYLKKALSELNSYHIKENQKWKEHDRKLLDRHDAFTKKMKERQNELGIFLEKWNKKQIDRDADAQRKSNEIAQKGQEQRMNMEKQADEVRKTHRQKSHDQEKHDNRLHHHRVERDRENHDRTLEQIQRRHDDKIEILRLKRAYKLEDDERKRLERKERYDAMLTQRIIGRLKHTGTAVLRFSATLAKVGFVSVAGQATLFAASLASINAALAIGRFSVATYNVALKGLAVSAAAAATAIGVAMGAYKQWQEAQIAPYLIDAGSSGSYSSKFSSARQLAATRLSRSYDDTTFGLLGNEGMQKISSALARAGSLSPGRNNLIARNLFNITGGDASAAAGLANTLSKGDIEGSLTALQNTPGINAGALAAGKWSTGNLLYALGTGSLTGSRFSGLSDAMSNTVVGRMKTSFAGMQTSFAAIGEPLLNDTAMSFSRIVNSIKGDLFGLRQALKGYGEDAFLPYIEKTLGRLSNWFRRGVLDNIQNVSTYAESISGFFESIHRGFKDFGRWLNSYKPAADVAMDMFRAMGLGAGGRGMFRSFSSMVEDNADSFRAFGMAVGNVAGAVLDLFALGQNSFFNRLGSISSTLGAVAHDFVPAIGSLMASMAPILSLLPGAIEGLSSVLSMLAPILESLLRSVGGIGSLIQSLPGGMELTGLALAGGVMAIRRGRRMHGAGQYGAGAGGGSVLSRVRGSERVAAATATARGLGSLALTEMVTRARGFGSGLGAGIRNFFGGFSFGRGGGAQWIPPALGPGSRGALPRGAIPMGPGPIPMRPIGYPNTVPQLPTELHSIRGRNAAGQFTRVPAGMRLGVLGRVTYLQNVRARDASGRFTSRAAGVVRGVFGRGGATAPVMPGRFQRPQLALPAGGSGGINLPAMRGNTSIVPYQRPVVVGGGVGAAAGRGSRFVPGPLSAGISALLLGGQFYGDLTSGRTLGSTFVDNMIGSPITQGLNLGLATGIFGPMLGMPMLGLGLGGAAASVGGSMNAYRKGKSTFWNSAASVGGGALAGAAIGSVIPVLGTGVGAVLGGLAGGAANLVSGWLGGRRRKQYSHRQASSLLFESVSNIGTMQEFRERSQLRDDAYAAIEAGIASGKRGNDPAFRRFAARVGVNVDEAHMNNYWDELMAGDLLGGLDSVLTITGGIIETNVNKWADVFEMTGEKLLTALESLEISITDGLQDSELAKLFSALRPIDRMNTVIPNLASTTLGRVEQQKLANEALTSLFVAARTGQLTTADLENAMTSGAGLALSKEISPDIAYGASLVGILKQTNNPRYSDLVGGRRGSAVLNTMTKEALDQWAITFANTHNIHPDVVRNMMFEFGPYGSVIGYKDGGLQSVASHRNITGGLRGIFGRTTNMSTFDQLKYLSQHGTDSIKDKLAGFSLKSATAQDNLLTGILNDNDNANLMILDQAVLSNKYLSSIANALGAPEETDITTGAPAPLGRYSYLVSQVEGMPGGPPHPPSLVDSLAGQGHSGGTYYLR